MVHWVYVLQCKDSYLYVGETTRLFRRFNEHLNKCGSSNTSEHIPYKLIGLYKVNENHSFLIYRNTVKLGEYNRFIIDRWGENEGDNLLIENHITERFLYERRQQNYNVRGGKYTKDNFFYWKNPIELIPIDNILDRPLCNCGNPSEVKLSKDKTKIYFVCSLKNVWSDFYSNLEVDSPCDFWQLYIDDKDVKIQYELVKARSREVWVTNVPLSAYKIHPEPCIICSKTGYLAIFNGSTRRLCQTCILQKYDLLKEKYSITFD
jgi:predicted GIY-YIG superfamily endonuclease